MVLRVEVLWDIISSILTVYLYLLCPVSLSSLPTAPHSPSPLAPSFSPLSTPSSSPAPQTQQPRPQSPQSSQPSSKLPPPSFTPCAKLSMLNISLATHDPTYTTSALC